MKLSDKIKADIDFDKLQEQFNNVISFSQTGIENPNTDELLYTWYQEKLYFIKAFGNKLIYELPEEVSFELTEEMKSQKINEFYDNLWRYEDKSNNMFCQFCDFFLLNKEGFYENRVKYNYPLSNGTVIKAGMKLFRAFKYFYTDKEKLNELQSAASLLVQENKFKGKICLSVHPLDFLSASENTYNWRSCHALDGDYRTGNLSYLVDNSTVMCYIKGDKDEIIPDFPDNVPWNSKKWRVWLFFSNNKDMVFAGRQYPFTIEAALNFVKDNLMTAVFGNFKLPWDDKYIDTFYGNYNEYGLNDKYYFAQKELVPLTTLVKDGKNSLQYNDLLYSHYYTPLYTFRTTEEDEISRILYNKVNYFPQPIPRYDWTASPRFTIGGAVKCLRCGKNIITNSSTMMCDNCEIQYGDCESDEYAYCPWCGIRYLDLDGCWVDGEDTYVCPDCFDEYVGYCKYCDTAYHYNHLIELDNGDHLCEMCYEGEE